jgi:hypothetical protein
MSCESSQNEWLEYVVSYLPLEEGDWREETAKVKKYLIQADLVDALRDYRLENFDKVILQTHLNKLAKSHSKDRVLQIRSYSRALHKGFQII